MGQYRIIRKLATGGMAEVYLGKLVGAGGFEKKVAIKRLLPALAADPAASEAFLQEARLCVHLVHPNVVQVLDLGTTGGAPYLVMELVDGEDLRRILNAANAAGAPLDPAEAIHVAACVAEALACADETPGPDGTPLHVVHRDVNPSNVMISMAGEVKLADFGVARAADGRQATEGNLLKGKLGYLAPELLDGAQAMHASDIFLTGVLLYEMLAGRPLFGGGQPGQTLAQIAAHDGSNLPLPENAPPALHPVLRRALARAPADRYPHARDLAADLHAVLDANRWRVGRAELAARMARLFPDRQRLEREAGEGVPLVDDRHRAQRPRPSASDFGVAPRSRRRRLGEMLVEANVITRPQLESILERQRREGGRLGEWVAMLGFAPPRAVLQVLARQLGVPFVTDEKLLGARPGAALIGAFPRDLAERLVAVPIAERGGVAWVATPDPGNLEKLDAIRFRLGRTVRPVVCTEVGLRRALDRIYGTPAAEALDPAALDFEALRTPSAPVAVPGPLPWQAATPPPGAPPAHPSAWPTGGYLPPLATPPGAAAVTPPPGYLLAWVPTGVGPDGQPLYAAVPVPHPVATGATPAPRATPARPPDLHGPGSALREIDFGDASDEPIELDVARR